MVSKRFEELDRQDTMMGPIVLRRRLDPVLGGQVVEVKLGDEFLMSSAFTASEEALSHLALGELDGEALHVLVGGLGLGYTALAALDEPRVASVTVVEALEPVIRWHRDELLPTSTRLSTDGRARLVHADFFALIAGRSEESGISDREFDAVLLDIDHTPRHVLHESHRAFYEVAGLREMRSRLTPGGVLGVWSDDPSDEDFVVRLREVFVEVDSHVVSFPNPYTKGESACTVYLARKPPTRARRSGE